ncbi:MAG: hypothetical protein IKE70_05630, partial [Bacilli bacterium]|nr:hypothetical protein [Bacilli bacterium]
QNKEEIKENKLFIMMDLELKELASISKDDKVVSKYMIELERINKDPRFVHFMSLEEDRKKRENTRIEIATEIGLERGITLGREEGITLGREEGITLGREEGRTLGREEGREEKTKELVMNLYHNHVDIKTLSKSTGLSINEIKKIIEND